MQLPGWYERYAEWSQSKGSISKLLPAFIGAIFGVVAANLIISSSGADGLLRLLGWVVLIGVPLAALDAWAAGIYRGQRIAPWVRLFVISGVGIVGGLLILLSF